MKKLLDNEKKISQRKPSVPGSAVENVYVPARGFLAGKLIKKRQVVRIIDLEGCQVADTIIWDANCFENVLNCCMTMMLNKKWNYWQAGDILYSKNCEKLAKFSADTTDGTHAPLGAFCNEAYWHTLTGISGCPNCRDNLIAAMAAYNFSAKDLDWNSCISLFMSVSYQTDGSIIGNEPKTKAGDYVDLMAEKDVIIAISNCPGERSLSAYNPTPLQVVIFEPNEGYKAKI